MPNGLRNENLGARIVVRPLSGPAEFVQAEEVQLSAWGDNERAVTPKEIMMAINDNGGFVLGAFEEKRMVGFAILLPGYNGRSIYMYSHMTGVVKSHQSRGIGYALKQKQRELSLRRGFEFIAWTFDPMIARNAYFNLGKLGAICRNYLVDYYGPMRDPVNSGLPTDRFLCEWFIRPDLLRRVKALAHGSLEGAHTVIDKRGREPHPVCSDWEVDLGAEKALVDIPVDVVELKRKDPAGALRWRTATRDAFLSYFAVGYSAVGLIRRRDRLQYILKRAELPNCELSHHTD